MGGIANFCLIVRVKERLRFTLWRASWLSSKKEDEYFRYQKRSYDSWADPESGEWAPEQAGLRQLMEAIVSSAEGPVLDLGCGRGRLLSYLRGTEAVGIDLSLNSLRIAKRTTGAEVVNADARHLPFRDGAFGTVLSLFTLSFVVPLDDSILLSVKSLLRPSGRFVFTITLWRKSLVNRGYLLTLMSAVLRRNRNQLRMLTMLTTIASAKWKITQQFEIEKISPTVRSVLIEARKSR